jgi:hypothetical protein
MLSGFSTATIHLSLAVSYRKPEDKSKLGEYRLFPLHMQRGGALPILLSLC